MKWTTGLEKCHAQALSPAAVSNFYDTLNDLVTKYDITKENIYNMDEKGIQLGMGKRVPAMVDQDQKTAYQVEDGDHELVTVIKCISANGTSIQPFVVFKSRCRNLEWGHDNPCSVR